MYLLPKNQYNGDTYYSDETSTVLCMIASMYSVTLCIGTKRLIDLKLRYPQKFLELAVSLLDRRT